MPGRAEQLFRKLQTVTAVMELIGQPEDAYFDCKEWPPRDDDAQRVLAKAASGLTNAEGGVLVIGMRARRVSEDEPDVVDSPATVSDTSAVKARVLNLIGNIVEPGIVGIDAVSVREQDNSTSGFVVVYVPKSDGSPVRSRKDWRFYQRIGAGTFPMEYFQIEERFGNRPHPKIGLYLEAAGIKKATYGNQPERCFILGLANAGRAIAKFPSLRFKRSYGLVVDRYGIDGAFGFGLPVRPSENEWFVFRGGVDDVIYPGETRKITNLLQPGENTHRFEPGQSQSTWVFKAVAFSCEISAEGIQTEIIQTMVPEHSQVW